MALWFKIQSVWNTGSMVVLIVLIFKKSEKAKSKITTRLKSLCTFKIFWNFTPWAFRTRANMQRVRHDLPSKKWSTILSKNSSYQPSNYSKHSSFTSYMALTLIVLLNNIDVHWVQVNLLVLVEYVCMYLLSTRNQAYFYEWVTTEYNATLNRIGDP